MEKKKGQLIYYLVLITIANNMFVFVLFLNYNTHTHTHAHTFLLREETSQKQ